MKTKWIVLIIIVVIAVGILGYVLFSQTSPSQTPPQTTTATSTTPSDTYGMSQYTDPTYGFSFWYPSGLQITVTSTDNSAEFPGGVAVETLQVGPAGGITIYVVNSTSSMITDEPANHASPIPQTQYFYDSASGQWMVDYPQGTNGGNSAATTTADISKTTISGLVMLPSGRRFDTSVIPLSTTQFLVIGDGGGSSFTQQLAETVTQAGATVNISAEEAALQAEQAAYVPSQEASTTTGTTIQSGFFSQETNATLGTYLTDENGRTLYTYNNDKANVSNCTESCLQAWPPYGPGISNNSTGTYNLPMLPANIGIIKGNNGMLQFTWKEMPLYYFAQDKQPGETLGQGVGGVWSVVSVN